MYFITTVTDIENKDFGTRCVGYLESLDDAVEIVKGNCCDICEYTYEYAVIEKVDEGLYPFSEKEEQLWFKYNDGIYESIDNPMIDDFNLHGIG